MTSTATNPTQFEGKRKAQAQGDAGLRTLLNANNLDGWALPTALSVTVSRSHKKSYALSTEFRTNQISTVGYTLKPGADYVYGPDSYIMFDLKLLNLDTGTATFGEHGSVLNIFKSVRLTHASGNEVEFVKSANLLNAFKCSYERTRRWRQTTGSVMGYNKGRYAVKGHTKKPASTDDSSTHTEDTRQVTTDLFQLSPGGDTFCVPLSILSEMFNADKLIPPYMLAGLRLQLELESPYVALQGYDSGKKTPVQLTQTAPLEFSLTNCEMHLDSHTLTDSVQKALARMSAMEGLDLHFPSWYADTHPINSGSQTVNVTKALSRVEDIQLVERVPAQHASDIATTIFNSMTSAPYLPTTTWQISIGSMFFPSHSVKKPEFAYILAQQGRDIDNDITFADFQAGGLGVMRGNMERSQILNGSGIAISATRGASIHVETTSGNEVEVFVKHTRLVSVFLDNVVVRT